MPVSRLRLRPSALRLPTATARPENVFREDLDRYIPSRRRMNMDLCRRKLASTSNTCRALSSSSPSSIVAQTDADTRTGHAAVGRNTKLSYEKQLLSTMYSVPTSSLDDDLQVKSIFQYGSVCPSTSGNCHRRRPVVAAAADPFTMDFLRSSTSDFFSGPITVPKPKRVISGHTVMQLDCPSLADDYDTHPLSWNKDNVVAVALGYSVYVMNESSRAVQEVGSCAGITPYDQDHSANYVRSVEWCTMEGQTHLLAVGTSAGIVKVYDTIADRVVMQTSVLSEGRGAVRALCWNSAQSWMTAGFASGQVASVDFRSGLTIGTGPQRRTELTRPGLPSVSSAVCNIAWNSDGTCLASGRNDNVVHLWDASMMQHSMERGRSPRLVLKSHTASVKGLAWCPYRRNVLASGGGLADGCIKLWNASSGNLLKSVSTGSQVSSLVWGQHHQELYSGHGSSEIESSSMNGVVAWSFPKMEQMKVLSSHEGRILSMGLSPDGTKLASVGADEMLWIRKIDDCPSLSRSRCRSCCDGACACTGVCTGANASAKLALSPPSFGSRFAIR